MPAAPISGLILRPEAMHIALPKITPAAVPIAVVTRSCKLDWSAPLFTQATARPLVITVHDAPEAEITRAAEVADVIRAEAETATATPGDLIPDCSCPDNGYPCKHAAALCYQTARLLDEDPFVLFLTQSYAARERLGEMGEVLFGSEDPAQVYFRGRTHQIERTPDGYILSMPLPFVEKGEVNLLHAGDELMVQIGQARRNIILPLTLVGLTTRGASFEDDVLKIRFGR